MSSPRRIERTGAVNRRTSGIFSPVFNLCCLKQSYSSLVLDMAHRGGKGREEIVRESTIRLDMATFRHSCQHDGKFSPALWVWGGGRGLQAWRKTEQPYSPNLSDSAECVILCTSWLHSPVPKFIDPVFAKTSPKCSFCMTENERFGFVFAKT